MNKVINFFKTYRWQTAIIAGYLMALFPFFQYGYWMTLDFGLTPSIDWIPIGGGFWLIFDSIKILSLLMPVWLAEKIIVLGMFGLLGWGATRLTHQQRPLIRVFATLLILYNPWIYGRLMDGQLNIISIALGSVWLLFWLLESLKGGLSWRRGLMIVLLSGLMPAMTHHSLVIVALTLVVWGLVFLIDQLSLRRFGKVLLVGLGVLGINSYLLWGYVIQGGAASGSQVAIEQFNVNHFIAFKTRESNLSVPFNTAMLRGYRGETQHRFPLMDNYSQWRRLSGGILLLLVVAGSLIGRKREKVTALFLVSVGIVAWGLGQGLAGPGLIGQTTQWLYDHLPFYQGMREPQKWIGLLLIVYVYLASVGLGRLHHYYLSRKGREILLWGLMLLPVWMTPQLLMGCRGQIVIKSYPDSWKNIRDAIAQTPIPSDCILVNEVSNCHRAIVLPWHGYMVFPWIGKNVGGWIGRYFGEGVIFGDTVEYKNIYTQSMRPESKLIEKFVRPGMGRLRDEQSYVDVEDRYILLKSMGIQNIIVVVGGTRKTQQRFAQALVEQGYAELVYKSDEGFLYSVNDDFMQLYKQQPSHWFFHQ